MRDMKSEMGKSFSQSAGAYDRCSCGKRKLSNFPTCRDCAQKGKSNSYQSSNKNAKSLRDGYLADGYFEIKNGKKYIKEAVFIKWAQDVSADLRSEGLSPTAIRNFFNKLRAVEHNYKVSNDFDKTRQEIYSFCRDVKYTENRGVTPELFTKFIDANIALAKEDPEHFKAFIEHFQSVIAYFKDKN
jgi:CRISPR type III-A-associated protein Csm2